jgi:predicted amidophosphoribosyltransferase
MSKAAGRKPNPIRLSDLADVYLDHILDHIDPEDTRGLRQLQNTGLNKVPRGKRLAVSQIFYRNAKILLWSGNVQEALVSLKAAHDLDPPNQLFEDRLRLLREGSRATGSLLWRMKLQDMRRGLGLECAKGHCHCESLYEIARCRNAIEAGFVQEEERGGVKIYTVGPYRPYCRREKWTKLLWRVKHQFESELLVPMAEVMADFVIKQTPLLKYVDLLVPVPPSPEKFRERGFAPNDIVADYLGPRLGLPVRKILLRKAGVPTREALMHELAAQFEVRPALAVKLKGTSILLAEDIWTRGRTIPICAQTLLAYGAERIFAVALGKTG